MEFLKFPEFSSFKRIILSVNSSGATDYTKLTTKATSIILRSSTFYLDTTYNLFKRIAKLGHIPPCMKQDKIVFLYKRKGDTLDAANYRPITHAPALGKHFEKIILNVLEQVPDKNSENHAYTSQHSIFSAITNLITQIQRIKRLNETHLNPQE